ncbi:MAG: transposase, partial [Gammaproteobacteria bacterium]|nr:transposase [Gammaproteobacteria bacterium]
MNNASYFLHPKHEWQRRYETLRACFIDRLSDKAIAARFGYKPGYVRLLKHQFRHGKIDFSEPIPEGKKRRRRVTQEIRSKICEWRRQNLSAGEITELLSEDGTELSIRTVERVLTEEGFPKLPRRTQIKIGLNVQGGEIPEKSEKITLGDVNGKTIDCPNAGVFLFAPFLAQFDIDKILSTARLPGSKIIPAKSYFLSFLSLKLLGNERYAHVDGHAFDPGVGLFAGLNVLPKCTAMSTYSYSLDDHHILALQKHFVAQAYKLGLYGGDIVNLDFHTAPHFGEQSELEKHWAGARNKRMKGALCLFAQDAASKLMLYTACDIKRNESDDQVLSFLSYWKGVEQGLLPTFIFDSKFTTYPKLSELNNQKIKFVTLKRRGKKEIEMVDTLKGWERIRIPHAKRKYPNPYVHESYVELNKYDGMVRQLIVRGNGREKPTFLITNDFDTDKALILGNYARRWRVENGIAEAVKFFHLNALSSPILVKIYFDIAMTLIADTLYSMLTKRLRGFENCDAPKVYRNFIRGKGTVTVNDNDVTVTYPKRAHNPILRKVAWSNLPKDLPGLGGVRLNF